MASSSNAHSDMSEFSSNSSGHGRGNKAESQDGSMKVKTKTPMKGGLDDFGGKKKQRREQEQTTLPEIDQPPLLKFTKGIGCVYYIKRQIDVKDDTLCVIGNADGDSKMTREAHAACPDYRFKYSSTRTSQLARKRFSAVIFASANDLENGG